MSLGAVASALVVGALTIGTAIGSGGAAPTEAPVFRAIELTPASSQAAALARETPPGMGAPTTSATDAPGARSATSVSGVTSASGTPLPSPVTRAACASSTAGSAGKATGLGRASAGSGASADPSTTSATTRRVAAFLGDSYTSGYVGAGLGAAGWPAIVAKAIGLRPLVRAVPGTGFVNPGWTGQPIRSRLASVIRANPSVVFLAGGHNDRRYATSRSAAAAHDVIVRLRRGLPDALVVIIGPIWANGNPPAHIRALRDVLRKEARSIGAVFIDPLRGGWFAGSWHRLILSDGIHPSNEGHRRIATQVLRALRADEKFAAKASGTVATVKAATAPAANAAPAADPAPAGAACRP
jgi:lysophospholipase L1-like esterase